MARPRTPILSRAGVTRAALAIIDADGIDGLSTRRLAEELGVRAPSLYNHFTGKDDILDAVADLVIEDVDIAVFAARPWDEALRVWARSYRAALVAHPNIVPFMARGPGLRPSGLRLADAVYGALTEAGWPRSQATRIGAMMRYLVTGSALGSFARGFTEDAAVYARDYPHLDQAHLLAGHSSAVDDGAFELGLESMLDSLVRLYPRVRLTGR
ncbi:TetR/AcrR family transcriptional regulator [Actinorugispora endophytica]|uniref:TetR family transcriptional regulator n=1 Tax=Actinorugispora endophytica TaxID=1605990 RepID=A0A4R6UJW6_9ACTN|nr:TetR/AcrR family transcriptional regulator [Actinorugispora endophytica]TDQ45739.1 TetR family transcriptional regulator [Actinorugispora endophytica]